VVRALVWDDSDVDRDAVWQKQKSALGEERPLNALMCNGQPAKGNRYIKEEKNQNLMKAPDGKQPV
jgi:hypothetical protein